MNPNSKYGSELERLLSHMILKCMKADGRIPHYLITQTFRPYTPSSKIVEILNAAGIQSHVDDLGPRMGKRGSYYSGAEVLSALQEEQNRLTEVIVDQPTGEIRRRRLWDQPESDDDYQRGKGEASSDGDVGGVDSRNLDKRYSSAS